MSTHSISPPFAPVTPVLSTSISEKRRWYLKVATGTLSVLSLGVYLYRLTSRVSLLEKQLEGTVVLVHHAFDTQATINQTNNEIFSGLISYVTPTPDTYMHERSLG